MPLVFVAGMQAGRQAVVIEKKKNKKQEGEEKV